MCIFYKMPFIIKSIRNLLTNFRLIIIFFTITKTNYIIYPVLFSIVTIILESKPPLNGTTIFFPSFTVDSIQR